MAKRSDESIYALPEVKDILTDKDANELQALLTEAHSLTGAEARLKELKTRIRALAAGQIGVRFNNLAAIIRFQGGKMSINRAKLVENGVSPQQIEDSMVEGEGYWVCELPKASL